MKHSAVKFLKNTSLLWLIALSFMASCQKNNSQNQQENYREIWYQALLIEGIVNHSFSQVCIADNALGVKDLQTLHDSCVKIQISPLEPFEAYPKTYILDFGSRQSCYNKDGRAYSGTVKAHLNKKITRKGSKISLSFENLNVDSIALNGKLNIELIRQKKGQKIYQIKADSLTLTLPDNQLLIELDKQHSWTAGYNTPAISIDEEFAVSGITRIVPERGVPFQIEVKKPLIFKTICNFIVSGKVKISAEKMPPTQLDYGEGLCDHTAIAKTDNKTAVLRLP